MSEHPESAEVRPVVPTFALFLGGLLVLLPFAVFVLAIVRTTTIAARAERASKAWRADRDESLRLHRLLAARSEIERTLRELRVARREGIEPTLSETRTVGSPGNVSAEPATATVRVAPAGADDEWTISVELIEAPDWSNEAPEPLLVTARARVTAETIELLSIDPEVP